MAVMTRRDDVMTDGVAGDDREEQYGAVRHACRGMSCPAGVMSICVQVTGVCSSASSNTVRARCIMVRGKTNRQNNSQDD